MVQHFFHRLAFKIGIVIIVIEIIVLFTLGWHHLYRFRKRTVQRISDKIQIPAILMSQGLLPYSAATNPDLLTHLVGEQIVDSMIIQDNGYVIHACKTRTCRQILPSDSGIKPWLESPLQSRDPFIKFFSTEQPHVLSITPISGVVMKRRVFLSI